MVLSGEIEVHGADGPFQAYVASSERPNGVAVIVLQEIFGVNANVRAIVEGFAAAGYVAAAPDLYWRQEPGVQLDPASEQGRERAMELMKGLSHDQAVDDGAAVLNALRKRFPNLAGAAAIGYCFGGGVAYLMATRGLVDAGVSYYGTGLQAMLPEMEALPGKLLLHIAADDHLCPPDVQQAIARAAEKAGEQVSVSIHPAVGHAFARIGGATFNSEAAERANAETNAILESLIPAP